LDDSTSLVKRFSANAGVCAPMRSSTPKPTQNSRVIMPGETRSFLISALEKIRHQTVESIRLIPLHPVGALIEQMKFCIRNELEEQDAALHRHAAVLRTP